MKHACTILGAIYRTAPSALRIDPKRLRYCAGVKLTWRGEGVSEKGIETGTERVLVEVDPRYFRPTEVDVLQGDSSKARKKLGWTHKTDLAELCAEMVREDLVTVAEEKRRNAE